jgi:hypothetical protein
MILNDIEWETAFELVFDEDHKCGLWLNANAMSMAPSDGMFESFLLIVSIV